MKKLKFKKQNRFNVHNNIAHHGKSEITKEGEMPNISMGFLQHKNLITKNGFVAD